VTNICLVNICYINLEIQTNKEEMRKI